MRSILTIPQVIEVGNISVPLSLNYQSEGALFGARISPNNPLQIAMATFALSEQYNGNPADSTLRGVANYVIFLSKGLAAQNIISGNGGGSVIPVPSLPAPYLIPITNTDFADATNYNNPVIVGKNLEIYWNDNNRYIYFGTEWVYTPTGINIIIPGFDATQNVYHLYIYIKD